MTTTPSPGGAIVPRPDFPVLDTLRAIGALAVVTTHTAFWSGNYLGHGVWGTLLSRLDVGVAIFFVLSGFLLTRPLFARAVTAGPAASTRDYYRKRVLRVYPLYAVTVVLALSLIPENADRGLEDWARTLLLLDTYTVDGLPAGLTQMWSLSVEVAFYALLPALMLVVLGRRRRLQAPRVAGVLVAMLLLSCWWHLDLAERVADLSPGVPVTWLPSYLTWFAVGIALAWAHVALTDARTRGVAASPWMRGLEGIGASPGVCWALVAGLMLVVSTPVGGPTLLFVASPGEALTKHLLYAAIGGLVVLTGVFARPAGRYAQVMSAPALRHLGRISYATFCIHLPILHLVMAITGYPLFEGHGWQIWAITVAISLAASEVLYRLVERPAMGLARRRRPRPGSTASEPSTKAGISTTT